MNTLNVFLAQELVLELQYLITQFDSNPGPPQYQADALPIDLTRLGYFYTTFNVKKFDFLPRVLYS